MPNITYRNTPGSGTLASGAAPTGQDISENWYYPTAAGNESLEVINGHLDADNFDPSFQFDNRHIQEDTVSRGKMVGCTANVDFFRHMFIDAQTLDENGTLDEKSDAELGIQTVVVPGLEISFFVPFDGSKVILQWSFNQQNDGFYQKRFDGDVTEIPVQQGKSFPFFALFIDDEIDPVNCRRFVPGANSITAAVGAFDGNGPEFQYGRFWSGHKLVTLNRGWHKADIRMMMPKVTGSNAYGINQTRVRARGMRYILFR